MSLDLSNTSALMQHYNKEEEEEEVQRLILKEDHKDRIETAIREEKSKASTKTLYQSASESVLSSLSSLDSLEFSDFEERFPEPLKCDSTHEPITVVPKTVEPLGISKTHCPGDESIFFPNDSFLKKQLDFKFQMRAYSANHSLNHIKAAPNIRQSLVKQNENQPLQRGHDYESSGKRVSEGSGKSNLQDAPGRYNISRRNYTQLARKSINYLNIYNVQRVLPRRPQFMSDETLNRQKFEQQYFPRPIFPSQSYYYPYYSTPGFFQEYDVIYVEPVPIPMQTFVRPQRQKMAPVQMVKSKSNITFGTNTNLNMTARKIAPQELKKSVEKLSTGVTKVTKKPSGNSEKTSTEIIKSQSEDHLNEYLKEIQEVIDCVNALSEYNAVLII